MIVSFAAAMGAFVASTLLSAVPLQAMLHRSEDIYANALPSLVELATLREQVHQLDDELSVAVEGRRRHSPDLDATIERLKTHAAAYSQNAAFGRADARWSTADTAIQLAVNGAAQVRGRLLLADFDGAEATMGHDVRPPIERADTELWRLVGGKAEEGVSAARSISATGVRMTMLSIGLDAACVVFTALLAMAAIRAVRRHTALIEARSRELEQFAGRVAHDLRGPLTPVLLAIQGANKQSSPGDPMHAAFERANRSLARMTSLVDDLLTFARAGGAPDPDASASLRTVVEATIEEASSAAQASSVTLRCESGDDVHAACSPGVLGSLLSNLVRNAVKYMGSAAVRQVVVRWEVRGQAVRVEVVDTGPGLPKGAESAVFEPYVRLDRTGQGGIGLGLATVKRLAEAHNGAVGVSSTARGSTFWFELPTRPAPQPG
jgi:signal transduction histidine kinase